MMVGEAVDSSAEQVSAPSGFAAVRERVAAESVEASLCRLRVLEARRRADAAEEAVLLARLDRERVYAGDGHASLFGLLRSVLGWSEGECRQRTRIARLVEAFADVGETLFEGEVSVANIAAIAKVYANPRCGDRLGEVLGVMLGEACRMEHADFRRIPQRWEMLADSEGAHRERALSHENRNAHVVTWDGATSVAGQVGDVDGPLVQEVFDRFVQAEFRADWEATVATYGDTACKSLMPRTDAQRRADALVAIFRQAVAAPPGSRVPEPVVNITVDYRTWVEWMTLAGLYPERQIDPFDGDYQLVSEQRCETSSGELVDPYAALQASLEGHVRFVVLNDEGVPIRWGRTRRLFTGAARQAVQMLATRCVHPGCRVRSGRAEIDHRAEWHAGGGTDPENGSVACSRHNRWKHRHRYHVHRDRHGHWHTYRPDGTEIT